MHLPELADNSSAPRRPAPMVPPAVALCAGIVAGRYLPLSTGLWAAVAGAGLAVALATLSRARWRALTLSAVLLAVGGAGAVHLRLALFALPDDHLVTFTAPGRTCATVRGRVATFPRVAPPASAGAMNYDAPPWTTFLLDTRGVHTDRGWQAASGLAKVTVYQPRRDLQAGQRVELIGWIGRFAPASNPGQFDAQSFYRLRHLHVRVTVPAADGVRVLAAGQGEGPLGRALTTVRSAARQHLARSGELEQGRLLNALIIGDRHPALGRLNDTLRRAGLAHFLSISGLHLGIFLGFVLLTCRLLGRPPRQAAIIALVILAGYLLLAQTRAPLLRSAIMAAGLCIALLTGRPYSAINALAAAAVALLAWDPLQLMDAGFQLSFVIVGGLILLHRPVKRWMFHRLRRRRALEAGAPPPPRRLARRAGEAMMDLATVAVTAYLVALPLVALHFGLISPYAPLLSILVLPMVVAVLVPGYLSLALAWPMPNLSWQLGRLAAGAADVLAGAVEWMGELPGLTISLRPVTWGWVLAAYGLLAMAGLRAERRVPTALPVLAGGLLIALTLATQRTAGPPPSAELHLLDVGAGQCAVLRLPSGDTCLLDAGSLHKPDLAGRILLPFLRELRLPAPASAVVSHANIDHYNALPALVERGDVRRVWLNEVFGGAEAASPSEADLLHQLIDHRVDIRRLAAGQRLELDERTAVEVLWPPSPVPEGLTVNDTSLVLRVTCDGTSVLLPGDLDEQGQATLLKHPDQLQCDVLVLPHHGGWETTLPDFVAAADPDLVLLSAAHRPLGPCDKSREFYRRLFRSYMHASTSHHGWLRVRLGRRGVDVQTQH